MNPVVVSKPVVLAISGHDPSGGAGIQADIEAILNAGCHPVTALTCSTAQNTHEFRHIYPALPEQLRGQVEAILEDIPVAACKIGLIPNSNILDAIVEILRVVREIPVVFDPVLASGTGRNLADDTLIRKLRDELYSMTKVLTPNTIEATRLSGVENDVGDAAKFLIDCGCEYVLVTGTHEQSQLVINRLFDKRGLLDESQWKRLPAGYHGSGCTLSAAIAAALASGQEPITAVRNAQSYTWRTLCNAYTIGRGQKIPQRLSPPRLGAQP